jgi:hypothetical protein
MMALVGVLKRKENNMNDKENLDIGSAYSDIFPGMPLNFELQLTNVIEIQTKTLEMFRDSLDKKGFDKNIADLMTVMYFNSTLNNGGSNGK